MKYRWLSVLLASIILTFTQTGFNRLQEEASYKQKLSDYGFFTGSLSAMNPSKRVIPYELNTPLFSDYAWKARFVYFPEGSTASYDPEEVMAFPVGTHIIKTFYYPKDFRHPEKGRNLMETRILIHEDKGWKALPYIWNEEQTEAYLDVAGGRKAISWKDKNGKKKKLEYVIPNMNQCKGCHLKGEKIMPIGPTARQLNGEMELNGSSHNQLSYWAEKGYLQGLPELSLAPKVPKWDDPHSGNLEDRARAYLDINCAHCHKPDGPANTSGLFLHVQETDPAKLGINKAPIAAGRGSGGRKYGIVPGKADESILLYRMESEDPGVRMPELARKMIDEEGVELIRSWINQMESK